MDMMNKSSEFVQRARVASSEQQFFTDVEIDTMDKLIVDTQVCYLVFLFFIIVESISLSRHCALPIW